MLRSEPPDKVDQIKTCLLMHTLNTAPGLYLQTVLLKHDIHVVNIKPAILSYHRKLKNSNEIPVIASNNKRFILGKHLDVFWSNCQQIFDILGMFVDPLFYTITVKSKDNMQIPQMATDGGCWIRTAWTTVNWSDQ